MRYMEDYLHLIGDLQVKYYTVNNVPTICTFINKYWNTANIYYFKLLTISSTL